MKPNKTFSYSISASAALEISSNIIKMCSAKQAAHMGGALSITDFLSVYYSFFYNDNDSSLFYSKGHACTSIYATLAYFNFFDSKELDKERGVILQEIGMYADEPDSIVGDKFDELAYPDQPMGRSILGTADIIKSISRDQVEGFMKGFYNPKKMVFSVSGNFEEEKVIKLVEDKFQNLPQGNDDYIPKSLYSGGEYREEKNLEQVKLLLGFEGVDIHSDLYYATRVYSTLLGSGMSSRLFQEIREKRGLVYSIYSSGDFFSDSGIFYVYAGTGQKEVKELIPVLCDQLNIDATTFTQEELTKTKAKFKVGILKGEESISSRCRSNASNYLMHNKIRSPEEFISKIDSVQLEDLEKARKNILDSNLTVSSIGPIEQLETADLIKRRLS